LGAYLYYGSSDGSVSVVEAAAGRIVATVPLGSRVQARPVACGGLVAVGTAKGEIVFINPEGLGLR
jgi:hypothetical protein